MNAARTPQQQVPFRLRAAERDILLHLNRYHFLTARQITRLLSSKGTEKTISKVWPKLKQLAERGYLQREAVPTRFGKGRGEFVYSLATPARQVLTELGEEVHHRFRPSEDAEHGDLYLSHTIGLTDVLIAGELLARLHPDQVRLDAMRHEREMRRRYKVEIAAESGVKRVSFEPDGWLDVAMLKAGQRHCLLIEYDNNTTRQARWRGKIAALLSFVTPDQSGESVYQRAFGRMSYMIVVVTSGGEARRTSLQEWTLAELAERGQLPRGRRFFFTDAAAAALPPAVFFGGAHWYQLGEEQPQGLLPLEEGTE